jgi:hypothetical protein
VSVLEKSLARRVKTPWTGKQKALEAKNEDAVSWQAKDPDKGET